VSRPVVAVVVTGLLATPATAAAPTIAVNPNPVHRGRLVRVHGAVSGCPRGDRVTLISRAFSHHHDFAGVPAIFARVAAGGAYSVRTRIPASREPSRYSITGRCGGGNLGVATSLTVLR
jgi:hypothetical protein